MAAAIKLLVSAELASNEIDQYIIARIRPMIFPMKLMRSNTIQGRSKIGVS